MDGHYREPKSRLWTAFWLSCSGKSLCSWNSKDIHQVNDRTDGGAREATPRNSETLRMAHYHFIHPSLFAFRRLDRAVAAQNWELQTRDKVSGI
jgi:hypothetical protein